MSNIDEFMKEALSESQKGMTTNGIPIGAVLVRAGRIIGKGHNKQIQDGDPTAHAEMDCIRNAGPQETYKNTIIYSTLMPCPMCAGAALLFGIPKVIVAENRVPSTREFLEAHGVEVVDLKIKESHELLEEFRKLHPDLWHRYIGMD